MALEGFMRLMALREACCSVAIETGEDSEFLFHKALLAEAGVKPKDIDAMAKKMAEKLKEDL